jgi:hypothetical protein
MPKGILLVETLPRDPADLDGYHAWYDGPHLDEVLRVEGIVAARRFAPVPLGGGEGDGEGPYVAVYEIEADDLAAVVARLRAAAAASTAPAADVLATDPPPAVRLLATITERSA